MRRGGDRIRVTAQLIDAETDNHVWAEKFDGRIEDIFDLQDAITAKVISAIEPKIRETEIARARRKRPENLTAYDFYLRALPHLASFDPEQFSKAQPLLDRAIELDAGYASAMAWGAWCRAFLYWYSWSTDPMVSAQEGVRLAELAIKADPNDPVALVAAGFATVILTHDHDRGLSEIEKSLAINPNSSLHLSFKGFTLAWCGEAEAAIVDFRNALRLSPFDSWSSLSYQGLGFAYFLLGNFSEGLDWARKSVEVTPDWIASYRPLAVNYAGLSQMDKARAAVARHMEMDPDPSLLSDGSMRTTS